MIIFNYSFPKNPLDYSLNTFYHIKDGEFDKNKITFSCLSSDSYFNGANIGDLKEFCSLTSFDFCLKISGKGTLKWFLRSDNFIKLLSSETIDSTTEKEYLYKYNKNISRNSVLYFTIQSNENEKCTFYGGTCQTEKQGKPIFLLLSFCTYHREKELNHNIETLLPILNDEIRLNVIDNGNSLCPTDYTSPFIRILPNKNLGGSGGFARAMLESLEDKKATHIILMDDDIEIPPQLIEKIKNILSLLNEKYQDSNIGASMLSLKNRNIIAETGAQWKGFCSFSLTQGKGLKNGTNISTTKGLIKNAELKKIDYQGWWFMVLPIKTIQENGLPLPFFIKSDDIEYSLRIHKKIITMNGIGVWHQDFCEKFKPALKYYTRRNDLVLTALHHSSNGKRTAQKRLFFSTLKNYTKKDWTSQYFIYRAYLDFLQGPEFLLKTDSEHFNKMLSEEKNFDKKKIFKKFFDLKKDIKHTYRRAAISYQNNFEEMKSVEFWKKILNLK